MSLPKEGKNSFQIVKIVESQGRRTSRATARKWVKCLCVSVLSVPLVCQWSSPDSGGNWTLLWLLCLRWHGWHVWHSVDWSAFVLWLQPFHYNFASSPSHLQTYTRSRWIYVYQTFNTQFRVLAQVLVDVLGPTACSMHFSGEVILISTAICTSTHIFSLPTIPCPHFAYSIYVHHHAVCSFDLPLMKALGWPETFGRFSTSDICSWFPWLVKFSIPNHVRWIPQILPSWNNHLTRDFLCQISVEAI